VRSRYHRTATHIKSSSHALSLHRLTINFPWLSSTNIWTELNWTKLSFYCTPLYAVVFSFSWLSSSLKLTPLHRRVTDLQKTYVTCQNAWHGPHRKHNFLYCYEGMFTATLSSKKIIRCRGNSMFSDPLLSNGYTRSNIFTYTRTFLRLIWLSAFRAATSTASDHKSW
jgi:hypothetical protein